MPWVKTIVVLALLAPRALAAAPRTYTVDVAPAPEVERDGLRPARGNDWRAEALAVTLAHDLADDRLALATGPNADLIVHATIDDRALRVELRATWPGAPAPRSLIIALGGDRATMAGQLRDELHRLGRVTSDDRAEVAASPPGGGVIALALALVAGLLAIPFLIGRVRSGPALHRAVLSVAAVGGGALVATSVDLPWLLAGGLAWGTFVAVTAPIVFPPVIGFGRIEQGQLARVTGSWLAAVARRAGAVLLFYAPVAVIAWLASTALGVDGTLALAVIVPVVLLAARLWVRCATAVAAARLDARLVDPSTDVEAWHAATRAYVVGYLRRNGLPVDDELLARVRLLPGQGEDVCVYGGGLTESRIVIPRRMLELALAPAGRPHDYVAPRVSTLHWTQWNAGLVVPSDPGAVIATREQRQPRSNVDEGEHERQLFGEPPTLAGTIEPSDLDERKTYRPEEDRIWLDWDPGEEYDGTDPGDRDFLFGAVVHALGEIQRHADRLATFVLLANRTPRATALGDDHAALAGARHHLVQYLGWRLWRREDLLTARAFAPELETATHKALALARDQAAGDARLRARLVRLGDPERAPRWRRFAVAGAFAAAVALVAIAVVGAVRYHATYVQETSHG
jgi:hypothetical protein